MNGLSPQFLILVLLVALVAGIWARRHKSLDRKLETFLSSAPEQQDEWSYDQVLMLRKYAAVQARSKNLQKAEYYKAAHSRLTEWIGAN